MFVFHTLELSIKLLNYRGKTFSPANFVALVFSPEHRGTCHLSLVVFLYILEPNGSCVYGKYKCCVTVNRVPKLLQCHYGDNLEGTLYTYVYYARG